MDTTKNRLGNHLENSSNKLRTLIQLARAADDANKEKLHFDDQSEQVVSPYFVAVFLKDI